MSEVNHKATLICTSVGDGDEVQVEVRWSPDIDGTGVEELGYLPASFRFLQDYILPALEVALMEGLDAPEATRH